VIRLSSGLNISVQNLLDKCKAENYIDFLMLKPLMAPVQMPDSPDFKCKSVELFRGRISEDKQLTF